MKIVLKYCKIKTFNHFSLHNEIGAKNLRRELVCLRKFINCEYAYDECVPLWKYLENFNFFFSTSLFP